MSKSSKKLIRAITSLLMCALLMTGMCLTALGAFDRDRTGSLTIELITYDKDPVAGGTFKIYYVASIIDDGSQELRYKLDGEFAYAESIDGLIINNVKFSDQVMDAAKILQKYVANVPEEEVITHNRSTDGNTVPDELKLGIYLVVQTAAPSGYTTADPLLVYVPMMNSDGNGWDYAITAQPKVERRSSPPPGGDTTSVTATKVWDDAGYEAERPSSVEVGLYRDGALYGQAVTLSASNNWTYTWRNLSTDYTWTADELEAPDGYIVLVDPGTGGQFTITNMREETVPLGAAINVTKNWSGDDAGSRPESIGVTLYRDGQAYETVTLTAADGWAHSWIGLESGYTWLVEESAVPEGYASKVDTAINGFVITNTYHEDGGIVPQDPGSGGGGGGLDETDIPDDGVPLDAGIGAPQTGMLQWPIPVLMISGMLFITTGVTVGSNKRKHGEK